MDENQDQPIETTKPAGRSASVRLRDRQSTDRREQHQRMDAAHQSLADALRITYRLLQGGMVVLVLLYLFSGFQSINEGERGVSVRFGKIVQPNLEPGFQWSWPYPIGEVARVEAGSVELPIGQHFMPNLPGNRTDPMEADIKSFSSTRQLDPANNGFNITADLNIAHTQWRAYYRRSNHAMYLANIFELDENAIVRAAVERGVVRSVATIEIDELLKNSNESVSEMVRVVAQETLDELDSGITIDRVVLARKSPPTSLIEQFSSVQSAAQNAGKNFEDAMLERDQVLNETAGAASGTLIEQINEFERLTEIGDTQGAEAVLAKIDLLLVGEEVEINGEMVQWQSSGEVSELISNASATASAMVSQAIAGYQLFEAKQSQFEANPELMIARDWSDAMTVFLNKDFVSSIMLPTGVSAEMLINNDPEIQKEMERRIKQRLTQESYEKRMDEFERDLRRSRRGIEDPEQ